MSEVDKKQRLQFDLSAQALRDLDDLKVVVGATTRAELLRKALQMYGVLVAKSNKGYSVLLRRDGDERDIELLLNP